MNCTLTSCLRFQTVWKPIPPLVWQSQCRTVTANSKAVKKTMDKFLARKKSLKKLSDSAEDFSQNTVPLISSNTASKKLSRGVLSREKTIANKLKNEIQELIETGALGSELQELNIKFSEATMTSSSICKIMWEPYCSPMDLKISEILNGSSKRIRHTLTTNHVMGNVPQLYFYIDNLLMHQAQVEKLFQEGKVDLGPEPEEKPDETGLQSDSKDDLWFGLDYDEIYTRLQTLKKTNKVEKG